MLNLVLKMNFGFHSCNPTGRWSGYKKEEWVLQSHRHRSFSEMILIKPAWIIQICFIDEIRARAVGLAVRFWGQSLLYVT